MLGRSQELSQLQRHLRSLTGSRVIVLDGPAGSGRTALLAQAAVAADRAGLRVARWRAGFRTEAVCSGVARGLLAGAGATESAPAGPGDVAEAAHALWDAAWSTDAGLCLVLDDAHLADQESLELLVHLSGGPPDVPLALLLAAADGWARPTAARLLDELRAAPDAVLVQVGALPTPAAAALLRFRVPDADEAFCTTAAAYTGGNAFLMSALAAELAERGVRGEADDAGSIAAIVPERVQAVIASRLRILGEEAAAVARAVAVLGEGAMFRHVVGLTGLAQSLVEQAADALVRTRLCAAEAGGLTFVEPVVAAAVAAGQGTFERRRWHRGSAELLAAELGPLERIARHLGEATPSADPWVVEQLVRAANSATERGDIGSAVEHLRRALTEPPSAEMRAAVLADLAIAESRISAPEAAARVKTALEESAPEDRVALLREQARVMWLSGRPADAVRWSERALADMSPQSDVYGAAVAELLAAVSMHDLVKVRSFPILDELLRRSHEGWVPETAALAGTFATVLPFTLGDHRLIMPLVERGLTEDLWRLDAPPYGLRPDFVISGCFFADELQRGLQLASKGLERAHAIGDAVRVGQYNFWRAIIGLSLGDLQLVLDAAYGALEAIATAEYEMSLPFCAGLAALAHLERGEKAAAHEVLALAQDRGAADALSRLGGDDARVHLLVDSGQPEDAMQLARSIAERLMELSHHDGPLITWRVGAVRAALATGELAVAAELAEEEVACARATHYRGRLGRALRLAAAVATTEEGAIEQLEEAVGVLAATPRRLDRAHALLALGTRLHGHGRVEAAREALAEARELASRCGAAPLAARALAALHATGARPRRTSWGGPNALTMTERRIAELAADGMTNRAIAEQLVVAHSTVEWHLTRAYAKLGIRSRRDLASALERG